MKLCIKCNIQLEDTAKFCHVCGTRQEMENDEIKGEEQKDNDLEESFFSPLDNKEKYTQKTDIKPIQIKKILEPQDQDESESIGQEQPEEKDKLDSSATKNSRILSLLEQQKKNFDKNGRGFIKRIDIKKPYQETEHNENGSDKQEQQKPEQNKPVIVLNLEKTDPEIVSYEFVDESVTIDDPYSSGIDVAKEEEKSSREDNFKKAQEILLSICIDEKMERSLYPLISTHVRGFRCIITGNDGTNKEQNIEQIGRILKLLNKVDEETITYIPFGKMPKEFDTRKVYVIGDLGSAIERLFNLDDLSDEANHLQQEYVIYMERLLKAPKSAYIILNGYDKQLKGFLSLDPRIRYIFDQIIQYPDLTNREIYKIFFDSLPDFHRRQLPAVFQHDFEEYLERNRRFFPFNNKELALYLAQTASKQPEFKLPKERYNAASLEEAFSSIIGMKEVKDQIYELNAYLKARKDLEKAGAKLPDFHMHMMLLGNPGVGKTTIARIISKILFDLGYIREEKLIEVTSKDLVGNGNQTGIKTNKAILNALGGVLFIDEAYSLAKSCGQAGEESIATLVKAMEDYKGDLVLILAGYTLEMNDFVKVNSGIASRIAYTFQFQDYNEEELYEIFKLKIRLANMYISPQAEKPIKDIIEWGSKRKNFGNGRYIDKLIQRTLTKHATLNLPRKSILTLKRESIPTVEEIMQTFGKFIGM